MDPRDGRRSPTPTPTLTSSAGAGAHRFQPVRAEAGIGAIVFLIAALLVASTTVGVFFQVVGGLESDVEATGDNVNRQVTGGVSVVAVYGEAVNGSIEAVRFTVAASGERPVDLRKLSIQWTGSNGGETFTAATGGDTEESFAVTQTTGADDPKILTGRDRATVEIRTVDAGGTLQPGDQATVTFIGESQTEYRLRVPASLDGGSVAL